MRKKIIGILVCLLLILNASVVISDSEEKENTKGEVKYYIFEDSLDRMEIRYIEIDDNIENYYSQKIITNMDDNLLPNPSFEDGENTPNGWAYYDWGDGVQYGLSDNDAKSGLKSVYITNIQRCWRHYFWYNVEPIPVDLINNTYVLSSWIKIIGEPPIQQSADIYIEPLDINKKSLGYIWGTHVFKECEWKYRLYYSSRIWEEDKEKTRYVRIMLSQVVLDSDTSPNGSVITMFDDVFFGIGENQPPSKPERPYGYKIGRTGEDYGYKTSAIDEGDRIGYNWSWGDGTYNNNWGYDSGYSSIYSHIWSEPGIYEIKVKAYDNWGGESEWSDPLIVLMTKTKTYNSITQLFSRMFNHFPFFEKILKQILI